MERHEQLDAWQAAYAVALGVYAASRRWPRDEQYGLTSQARRAAVSVAANIAEGSARRGSNEFRRFVDIAIASQTELRCLLRLADDLGYTVNTLRQECRAATRLVWALRRSLANHS